jgi:hypothetical protein
MEGFMEKDKRKKFINKRNFNKVNWWGLAGQVASAMLRLLLVECLRRVFFGDGDGPGPL